MQQDAQSDAQFDVFLSHSFHDKDIVRALAERMRADGLRVWLDAWEIKVGDSIPVKIDEGLAQSKFLVLCMSAHSSLSDWTQLESQTVRFDDPLNRNRRFAWSFYSQGTDQQAAASSDLFIHAALRFFGETELAGSSQSGVDKARRLAQVVGARRVLLILDGDDQGAHAFRVMDAYAQWLAGDGVQGQRALALLRLLGLFDRPASAELHRRAAASAGDRWVDRGGVQPRRGRAKPDPNALAGCGLVDATKGSGRRHRNRCASFAARIFCTAAQHRTERRLAGGASAAVHVFVREHRG